MWDINWDGPSVAWGFLISSIVPGLIGWLVIHLRAPAVEDPTLVKWVVEKGVGWRC